MNDLDTELTVGLSSLVDTPAPPCSMNVSLARETGRTLKRRRRNITAGSALAAVGLAGALVAAGLSGLNHTAGEPVTGPGPSTGASVAATASATPGPQSTPNTSDPVLTTLAFGWLPSAAHTSYFQWSTGGPLGDGTTIDATGGGYMITANMQPAGTALQPWLDGNGNPVASTPAPDVNGNLAQWPDGSPGHPASGLGQMVSLAWKNSINSWVTLSVIFPGSRPGDATAKIYQIAESMQFDLRNAVPVPFHLAQAPAGLPLSGSGWGSDGPASPAGLGGSVTYGDGSIDSSSANHLPQILTISVHIDTGARPNNGTHITVDGATAWIASSPYSTELIVYDVDGLDVSISVEGTAPMQYITAAGGIVAYFEHSITLLGPNQANWTTHVVD